VSFYFRHSPNLSSPSHKCADQGRRQGPLRHPGVQDPHPHPVGCCRCLFIVLSVVGFGCTTSGSLSQSHVALLVLCTALLTISSLSLSPRPIMQPGWPEEGVHPPPARAGCPRDRQQGALPKNVALKPQAVVYFFSGLLVCCSNSILTTHFFLSFIFSSPSTDWRDLNGALRTLNPFLKEKYYFTHIKKI
jgi:hypothetical protein